MSLPVGAAERSSPRGRISMSVKVMERRFTTPPSFRESQAARAACIYPLGPRRMEGVLLGARMRLNSLRDPDAAS